MIKMLKSINFRKMRKELIELYKEFLKNPRDETLNKKIIAYELQFGGLQVYNDYLKSQPVPKDIEMALSGLSTVYQYGLWEDFNEDFSNEKIISKAKKILAELLRQKPKIKLPGESKDKK